MGAERALRRMLAAMVAGLVAVTTVAASPGDQGSGHADRGDPHVHLGVVDGGDIEVPVTPKRAVYWETSELSCHGEECAALEWTVEVTPAAASGILEVALDETYLFDDVLLVVTSPDGESRSDSTAADHFSAVVRFEGPTPGAWHVEARPRNTRQTTLRLRAGIVREVEPTGELLPNLRAMPPFDFTFTAPVASNAPTAVYDTGIDVGGQRPLSCTPGEVQMAADPTQTDEPTVLTRCLRFSTGPENRAAGHLDLRFPIPTDRDAAGTFPMFQYVHHADGTTTARDAGTFEYHPTHAHYHHAEMAVYDLLAVEGEELEHVSGGVKTGFCPLDLGVADWWSFDHARRGTVQALQPGNCRGSFEVVEPQGAMGISAGWADVYDRFFDGQFVDFSAQGDGLYVVRVTIDLEDLIAETDETDNTSYALVRVAGDEVEVLERGYGTDHLDPQKHIATDGRWGRPFLDTIEGTRRYLAF